MRCANLHRHTQSGGTCWITSVRTLILQFPSLVRVLYPERRDALVARYERVARDDGVAVSVKVSTIPARMSGDTAYELASLPAFAVFPCGRPAGARLWLGARQGEELAL